MRLQGRVTIVTGAAHGIGQAIADVFAHEGARVALSDIDEAGLEKASDELKSVGLDVLPVSADVTRSSDVRAMTEFVLEKWQKVDVLVNNVGGAIGSVGLEVSESDWDATLALTLKSHLLCAQSVIPSMRGQGYGRIINMSSNAGKYRSNTGMSSLAYSSAKGGLLQFTRSLAHEVGPYGITVNAIAPGSVLSEAGIEEFESLSEELREQVLRETPLGYFAQPREIATIAAFLASDSASYVTGATILPSGGWCTS